MQGEGVRCDCNIQMHTQGGKGAAQGRLHAWGALMLRDAGCRIQVGERGGGEAA